MTLVTVDVAKRRAEQDDQSRDRSLDVSLASLNSCLQQLAATSTNNRLIPRTYPYTESLPYPVESSEDQLNHLSHVISKLYAAIQADDLAPGGGSVTAASICHWTRELKSWIRLKFDLPLSARLALIRVYYDLCLATVVSAASNTVIPGGDDVPFDKFVSMFCLLAREHVLLLEAGLQLDYKPLYRLLKYAFLPAPPFVEPSQQDKVILVRLVQSARVFFDKECVGSVMEDLLPSFSPLSSQQSHPVISLLMYFTPPSCNPQTYLPSLFHLWKTLRVSKHFDFQMLDYMSRLAADGIQNKHLSWHGSGRYGIFNEEQMNFLFSVILSLSGVTVVSCPEPYHVNNETRRIDHTEIRKAKPSRAAARLIISCLGGKESENDSPDVLDTLLTLITSLESFFHPSNQGKWSKGLFELINLLVEYFLLRWNQEQEGQVFSVDPARFLTPATKRKFVLVLKNVVFFGIYSKNRLLSRMAINCLQGLAFLEPHVIIPQFLKEAYPSLQGLVETHRTLTTLQTLVALVRIISQQPRYRIHVTTLLSLALPGIDANDVDKTFQALSVIHVASLNVPFREMESDKSQDESYDIDLFHPASDPAFYITRDVEMLEETGELPELPVSLCNDICVATTSGFPLLVDTLFERLFNLLENLPDVSRSSKERDFPEAQVVSILTPMLMAVLGGVSTDMFEKCCARMADFISGHVIHTATDAIANMSGAMVRVDSAVACKYLLPVVFHGIRNQIMSNGAGSTRHVSSEILPRDRALIWHLSVLNLCVAHANRTLMDYQDELLELTSFLREKCRGNIIFHSANTVHHILMSLTNLAVIDCSPGIDHVTQWGQRVDPKQLEIKWYVPGEAEVGYAVKLFDTQVGLSLEALNGVISKLNGGDSNGQSNGDGVTELSDSITRHVTYLRTSLAGISVLFDPCYDLAYSAADSPDSISDDGMSESSDVDADSAEPGDIEFEQEPICDDADMFGDFVELKKLREYPSGYFFAKQNEKSAKLLGAREEGAGGTGESQDVVMDGSVSDFFDTTYVHLHKLRLSIGHVLHNLHNSLLAHRSTDISSFKALLFALKVYLSDVGIEKTSKSVIIQIAAYSYEVRKCNTLGLRKDYPRAVLIRRALAHHHERLLHKFGARHMTPFEKALLMDILKSCLSIYPDIRRNAQSCLESAIKTIMKCRPLILPFILRSCDEAISQQQWEKAISACLVLEMSVMNTCLKRNIRHVPLFIQVMTKALEADSLMLNRQAQSLLMTLLNDGFRLPSSYFKFDYSHVGAIAPAESSLSEVDVKIEKMRAEKAVKREEAVTVTWSVDELMNRIQASSGNWKVVLLCCSIQVSLNRSFEMKTSRETWSVIAKGLTNHHPMVAQMYYSSFEGLIGKVLTLAVNGYEMSHVTSDSVSKAGYKMVETEKGFGERLVTVLRQREETGWMLDVPCAYGWMLWPKKLEVIDQGEVEGGVHRDAAPFTLSEHDKTAMSVFSEIISLEKIGKLIHDNTNDADDESDFSVESCGFVASLLRLYQLNLVSWTVEDLLKLVLESFDPTDKQSHRTLTEYFGGCLLALKFLPSRETRELVNSTILETFTSVIKTHLTPENVKYWWALISWTTHQIDPRLWAPIADYIGGFTIDESSHMAFKQVAKLEFFRRVVYYSEWHFDTDVQLGQLWSHVAHEYSNVRAALAVTLGEMYRVQYEETDEFVNVSDFLQKNEAANDSGLGLGVYTLPERLKTPLVDCMSLITSSDINDKTVTNTAKTLVAFIMRRLSSSSGRDLVPLIQPLLECLMSMCLVRDDPELLIEASATVVSLGDIALESSQMDAVVSAVEAIVASASHRKQKLALVQFLQVFFFRHQFVMTQQHRSRVLATVTELMHDKEVEIRSAAAKALSGILRCLPEKERDPQVHHLHVTFRELLVKNPAKRIKAVSREDKASRDQLAATRHTAVLGLGTIINAFPYVSPPPDWAPEILVTLATKAGSDSEFVGRSVKEILGDFKKTRQDTWHIDSKKFTEDQLADLEGVLWKPYFV
ncbi:Proteasome activator BLM10 [Yarrowia sp. E02]|nr:Proteasome activator BLM10 [Yarrowia sp. E02]